jgi:hypothetical protein
MTYSDERMKAGKWDFIDVRITEDSYSLNDVHMGVGDEVR